MERRLIHFTKNSEQQVSGQADKEMIRKFKVFSFQRQESLKKNPEREYTNYIWACSR